MSQQSLIISWQTALPVIRLSRREIDELIRLRPFRPFSAPHARPISFDLGSRRSTWAERDDESPIDAMAYDLEMRQPKKTQKRNRMDP